ncbi:MAG: glyoxylate/hydroxypyruvate reductase A [Proteobacteria bacterium]|nr:glyoxylate/hydroxypyruvate reductase A [Pseudomonadota bacterium]
MSIMIVYPNGKTHRWVEALHAVDPALKVEVWPEISDPGKVSFALCWNQPPGVLRQFPNLKCISSLGAGVEHLLGDATRPASVPLTRLVDDDLKQFMAEYVMLGILEHLRRFEDYRRQQKLGKWARMQSRRISTMGVGLMGFGEIGRYVGYKLWDFGFKVHAWTRTPKQTDHLRVYSGIGEFDEFLKHADILVCLLPLTPETQNILNAKTFSRLPANAYLINVGRGSHLVEDDLLAALDSGRLSGALLDVFREEPLPQHHPFWRHGKITITPHVASVTNPESVCTQIVENYRRALAGMPLLNPVNAERGY